MCLRRVVLGRSSRLEPSTGPGALFCGDSLFVGGCGRNFEGTAEQMHSCMIGQFADLAPETAVYCGHEYTLSNLRFAVRFAPSLLPPAPPSLSLSQCAILNQSEA